MLPTYLLAREVWVSVDVGELSLTYNTNFHPERVFFFLFFFLFFFF